jgi:L-histidine Nalpha-methyltransferase
MKSPQFFQIHHDDAAAVREEIIRGLSARHAQIAPKFLYDALGARLFEAITVLPEYYPTRTEAAILASHAAALAAHLPRHATLIDLGAGSCAKSASLFAGLQPARYVAVDISVDFLQSALASLQRQHPTMDMVGVGLDFSDTLALPAQALGERVGEGEGGGVPGHSAARIVFYPGSSIGNFTPEQALRFLQQVHAACGTVPGSGLLIGVDLVKDTATLEAAYDDALGVTAAFNRNLIANVNRCIGSDMRLADWAHLALYNVAQSRIEMHLLAQRACVVQWPGGSRSFAAGERIHTENSYKWTVDRFTQLLRQAGFAAPQVWTDATPAQFAVLWAPAQV